MARDAGKHTNLTMRKHWQNIYTYSIYMVYMYVHNGN